MGVVAPDLTCKDVVPTIGPMQVEVARSVPRNTASGCFVDLLNHAEMAVGPYGSTDRRRLP
ncbi:hypothetical protein CU100_15585 [Phyllobacterium endophyticum]|uniref:Uncharacterized protein n=1 Tax=Phyllobacterium endophyticum TaxID=1149773 RepID=A0A2P7ARF5_9HYPH|nr:hypothetical protein CU100_15585 [Phyllobacterium endophyticum]